MKIGIVYYSRTGNTKKVAEILEKKFKEQKADVNLIEIEHVKRPGFFTAGRSAVKQLELPIKNTGFDLKNYDFIITGSPTWVGCPSPFIKTFINKAENVKDKNVAIFGTGISPINSREKFKEILENSLKNVGFKTVDNFLPLRMKKGQIIEGEQNIDSFVENILKNIKG